MLVVTEDDELPAQARKLGAVQLLEAVDLPDVRDHLVEIPPDPIEPVRLLACTIDRAGHSPELELDDSLENLVAHMVEVYTVAGYHGDFALIRQLENLQELRVEKDLAVIRQLDERERGVLIEEMAKIIEPDKAAADRRMDRPGRCRTGRAAQLAERGRFEPDRARLDRFSHRGLPGCERHRQYPSFRAGGAGFR